jgi:hypothetical protein
MVERSGSGVAGRFAHLADFFDYDPSGSERRIVSPIAIRRKS